MSPYWEQGEIFNWELDPSSVESCLWIDFSWNFSLTGYCIFMGRGAVSEELEIGERSDSEWCDATTLASFPWLDSWLLVVLLDPCVVSAEGTGELTDEDVLLFWGSWVGNSVLRICRTRASIAAFLADRASMSQMSPDWEQGEIFNWELVGTNDLELLPSIIASGWWVVVSWYFVLLIHVSASSLVSILLLATVSIFLFLPRLLFLRLTAILFEAFFFFLCVDAEESSFLCFW